MKLILSQFVPLQHVIQLRQFVHRGPKSWQVIVVKGVQFHIRFVHGLPQAQFSTHGQRKSSSAACHERCFNVAATSVLGPRILASKVELLSSAARSQRIRMAIHNVLDRAAVRSNSNLRCHAL